MSRVQVEDKFIDKAIDEVLTKLNYRLIQKGKGSFSSSHEVLGVIAEEYKELIDAVHKNGDIESELLDIAVGAIFGVACVKANGFDW